MFSRTGISMQSCFGHINAVRTVPKESVLLRPFQYAVGALREIEFQL